METIEILILIGIFIVGAVSSLTPLILIVAIDTSFVLKAFCVLININADPNTPTWKKEEIMPLLTLSGEGFFRIAAQILIIPLIVATLFVDSLPELAEAKTIVLIGWFAHLLVSVVLTFLANKILRIGGLIRETEIHISDNTYDVTYDACSETIHVSPQVTTNRSLMNYLYFFTGLVSNTICPIALYFGKKRAIKKHY